MTLYKVFPRPESISGGLARSNHRLAVSANEHDKPRRVEGSCLIKSAPYQLAAGPSRPRQRMAKARPES